MNNQPERKAVMTWFKRPWLLLAVTAMLFAITAQPATASSFTYTLTTGNSDLSGYPGPYGTVKVEVANGGGSNLATITFTANPGFLFGGQGLGGVNANGTATVGSFSAGTMSDGGANNEDGFGAFSNTIDNFDGYTHALSSFSFILTKDSGTWQNASKVLTANRSGHFVAAHIFVIGATDALATGYATEGPNVPDGGMTIMLLGMALAGMGLVARRKL